MEDYTILYYEIYECPQCPTDNRKYFGKTDIGAGGNRSQKRKGTRADAIYKSSLQRRKETVYVRYEKGACTWKKR